MSRVSRRDFLRGLGAASALGVTGAAAGCGSRVASKAAVARAISHRPPSTLSKVSQTQIPNGPVVQTAAWVRSENSRPGSAEWAARGQAIPHVLEAYADTVSAQAGDTVTLYVSCQDPSFSVAAFRMGWYGGLGARLIWRSSTLSGQTQPSPTLGPATYTVSCAWAPSATIAISPDWPPGDYLLKLTTSSAQVRYVPLTVRDDSSRASYVIMNSVTTWQAYNWWGGYCLYYGPAHAGSIYTGPHGAAGKVFANRSRVVSFDRPYPHDWAYGAADFIGNELPMVMLAERLGLDVTYWTDVDLHRRPELLAQHRALISLGHDEYWSASMYEGALAASKAGVNLAFLGANACFRHIRFEPSALGADRQVVCYKVASEDPLYGVDNTEVTSDWPEPPSSRPESLMIGNMYQSNGVAADMVIVDPGSWVLDGTGLAAGDHLASLIGPEYDGYDPAVPSPPNLSLIAHSPVNGIGGVPGYADMTWFSRPGAGGVFATGTNWWVTKLGDNAGAFNTALVGAPIPGVTSALIRITENVLGVLGGVPGGLSRPSTGNWQQFYRQRGTSAGIASNYRTYWPA